MTGLCILVEKLMSETENINGKVQKHTAFADHFGDYEDEVEERMMMTKIVSLPVKRRRKPAKQ